MRRRLLLSLSAANLNLLLVWNDLLYLGETRSVVFALRALATSMPSWCPDGYVRGGSAS